MNVFYTDQFVLPLPEGHRFPMSKYALLRERVVQTGIVAEHELRVPEAADDRALTRAHRPEYVRRATQGELSAQELRYIGFPWSPQMIERSRRSSGATMAACRAALEVGLGLNLAGGTHHAFADRGAGYCVFNDSVVAARAMQAEGRARRVLVVDCDVHQGDGTAAICAGDTSIFTFSIHGQHNWPFDKQQSDLDVGLPDKTGDQAYLDALDEALKLAVERSLPDLAIYLAGADPFADDKLGRLSLSKQGLAARDRLVFERLARQGIPVAVTMAGGYARKVVDTVDIHAQTIALARALC